VLSQSATAHGGSSSVGSVTTSANYAADGVAQTAPTSAFPGTVAGTTYAGSCWIHADHLITGNVEIRETKSGSTVDKAIASYTFTDTTSWHQLNVSYTAANAGDKLELSAWTTNTKAGSATLFIDDCALGPG
jgi:hypothetical protein